MSELHQDEKNKSEKLSCLFVFLLSSPVLYALSLGPAVLIYDKLPSQLQKVVEAFYQPLAMVADKLEGFDDVIRAYLSLWGL